MQVETNPFIRYLPEFYRNKEPLHACFEIRDIFMANLIYLHKYYKQDCVHK